MRRKRFSRRRSNAIFNRFANKSKAINVYPMLTRGGFRL